MVGKGASLNGVVLIGPQKAGKTTVGRLLAQALDRPLRHSSAVKEQFRDHPSHDRDLGQIYVHEGYAAVLRFKRSYRTAVAERALQQCAGDILEIEPLYTITDAAGVGRLQAAARPYAAVVLLLPMPDVDGAVAVLEERQQVHYRGRELIEYFTHHPANRQLAKHVIYTEGKSTEQTGAEILARLHPASATVVLLGPPGAGKTTIGKMLAQKLDRPQAHMDALRWAYYREVGFDPVVQDRLGADMVFAAQLDYWKQFDVHAVRRILEEHAGSVIDLGAGHSVYDEAGDLAQVSDLLAPFPNVFLLLPTPDVADSVAILRARLRARTAVAGQDLNRYLITHPANRAMATLTIYTNHKTPETVRDEILNALPK